MTRSQVTSYLDRSIDEMRKGAGTSWTRADHVEATKWRAQAITRWKKARKLAKIGAARGRGRNSSTYRHNKADEEEEAREARAAEARDPQGFKRRSQRAFDELAAHFDSVRERSLPPG